MARAANMTDIFNAIAEPRRREVTTVLADGRECAAGEVAVRTGLMTRIRAAAQNQPLGS
jgi:hypothetical protein